MAAKSAAADEASCLDAPVALPAGDDFFVDPLQLAGMDKAVAFAKSEILRLDNVARVRCLHCPLPVSHPPKLGALGGARISFQACSNGAPIRGNVPVHRAMPPVFLDTQC